MRDNLWLREQLDAFLNGPFSDVELKNKLSIAFGRRAKRRFGSIKMKSDKKESRIVINGLFKDEIIPENIILATIAHELCHYAHGFSSPLEQKYKHPHRGGVILLELKKRGLESLYRFEKEWTKKNWPGVVKDAFPRVHRTRRRRRTRPILVKIIHDLIKP